MRLLRRLPIRARVTLWQLLAFGVIFGALAAFLVLTQRSTLIHGAQEALELTGRVVIDQVSADDADLTDILDHRVIPGEVGSPEVVGQIVRDGTVVLESSGGPAMQAVADQPAIQNALQAGHWHGKRRLAGRATDDMVVAVRIDHGSHQGDVLVLAQTLGVVDRTVRHSVFLAAAAAPFALVLAGLLGWVIAGVALRPVDDLTRTAAEVDPAAPHQSLPVPDTQDEVFRLATTLNGLLERVSGAVQMERRLAADASHELRTPISVMEAELDVALRAEDATPETRTVLSSVKAEVSALGRIVANLLLLSRAEATGQVELHLHEGDLLDLAYAVQGRLAVKAEGLGVEIQVEGDPTAVRVDADLLRQAVTNLVDNALVHSPTRASVVVRVEADPVPSLSVTDSGVGIPAEELPRIFDRFYRVDPARPRQRGGAGLGLEITRRIVEAHGGGIRVDSEVGRGSVFTVWLPPLERD